MHIGIAGAGLLGRLLALELSRAGHRVDVFDPASGPGPKAESGTEAAAWTAAGLLSPVAELECADARVFAWGLRSCYLWPSIVYGLGEPVALSLQGSLLLAHRSDAGAAERVVGLLQSKAGAPYQPELLDAKRAGARHPRPGSELAAALRRPDPHRAGHAGPGRAGYAPGYALALALRRACGGARRVARANPDLGSP